MRRGVLGIIIFSSFVAAATPVLAAEVSQNPTSSDGEKKKGVSSVTDAAGNPVPVQDYATPSASRNERFVRATQNVERGRAWWPYQTAYPPYNSVDRSAESLTEDEILVNGVVTLNIRNPQAALQKMPKDLVLEARSQFGGADGYYLIKIRGFSRNQPQVNALQAAGVVLGEFININTYIAKVPTNAYVAVQALPFVTFIGDYHPAYKISPRIGLEAIPKDIALDEITGEAKPWVFELTLHKGADLDDVLDALRIQGHFPKPEDIVSNGEMTVLSLATQPEALPSLAKIPGVKWIAEKTYPQLMASNSSPATIPMVLQNNGVFTTNTSTGWKLWNAGIKGNAGGTPQIITMMDSGLNTSMEHFSQDTVNPGTVGPAHRKVVGYDVYNGDQCVLGWSGADGGHGTWTTEHAVGGISSMSTNPDVTHTPNSYWDPGIAPDAKVYFQDIGNAAGTISPPTDLGPSIAAAIAKGSFVQNHSWGSSSPTYDTIASNLDIALFNNPNMVVTAAAGNRGTAGTGTIGSPCTAKNSICVGGNNVAQPDYLFQDCSWDGTSACGGTNDLGSSRGPVTTSNRVKPDICTYVAFSSAVGGENMAGNRPAAMCQTDATKTVYWDWINQNGFGGTSFSAPEAAGLALLVRDYFQAGFYPSGTATPANALTPSGSLVKAVILASGEDMATTGSPSTSIALTKRYGSDVGYGRANLPSVLHVGSAAPFLWVQNNDTLGDGATKSFFYTINGNGLPLRVMMVYYDAAGNALQKDCDLRVTIGADVYWGNNMSGGWSTTATSVRDHTNNTEGVFLDAAHGLPASGTVQVDVIGFSNPSGMNYSLVVAGDVAGQDVTQVSLDRGKYTCAQAVNVTVNDAAASSPVSVTLTTKDSVGTTIDTRVVSCSGSGGVFNGSITTGSGITVVDGGSLTATYNGVTPATASIVCQLALADGGFLINGGCDNAAAGTNEVNGPLFNGGVNEFYNKYMDSGEYSSYTAGFVNQTGSPLTDVNVTLSFSGPGASKMSVLNNPIHLGAVNPDTLAGAVFQLFTDPTAAGLTTVNVDFDITSPADGYTTPKRLTQVQTLQANDVISRQQQCSVFNSLPGYESTVTGAVANPWRLSSVATNPATVGSENRTDGSCNDATANRAMMVGNSGVTTGNNFALNADSFLLQKLQPALLGNGPNGQPYHYVWKWHSFYHASEQLNNQNGAWAAFYNDQWNNLLGSPNADQALAFPISLCCYYQTIFDYVSTWNWETANTGTPDDPNLGPSSGGAPNQLFINFSGVTGLATTDTYFAYGHEHWDLSHTASNHRDIALDNDRLVYDEYYRAAQTGGSCGGAGQVGQVAFDQYSYDHCPSGSAVLSVVDADAVSPLLVTVTSPGTGDSETVTLTGSAPYFSGTLALSTQAGVGSDNGTLFVLPSETINASYTDASPAGSSTATALTGCAGGNLAYVSNAQISDNGDNDGIADNGETVTLDLSIRNNMAMPLNNARVRIFPGSPNVDCIPDAEALYGTVAAGGTATNPPGDRFAFHVAPTVACSDFQNPPTAKLIVVISGDGLDGPMTMQSFSVVLDLDATGAGGSYTYSQGFTSDPGWTTGATPDDDLSCTGPYVNNFHWCAACGNGSGGYGAWIGDSPFGTSGQNYSVLDSSTLYSPPFVANGSVNLQFSTAYRTENQWDGAIVQYRLAEGAWTTLPFSTPAQALVPNASCSPLANQVTAWTGNGVSWTTTNAASVPSSDGQALQFRWRLGSDEAVVGTTYGGYGVDNVVITNLKQTQVCEPTRNTCLPSCPPSCTAPSALADNTATDLDPFVNTGVQVTWAQDPGAWGDVAGCGTRTYDVLRDGSPIASGIPYGTVTFTDLTGVIGITYTYSVRYNNGCGQSATTAGAAAADDVCVTPGEINGSLSLTDDGVTTTLSWTDPPGDYNVYRGSRVLTAPWAYNHVCFSSHLSTPSASDTAIPPLGEMLYYLVSRVNICGESGLGHASDLTPIPNSAPCP